MDMLVADDESSEDDDESPHEVEPSPISFPKPVPYLLPQPNSMELTLRVIINDPSLRPFFDEYIQRTPSDDYAFFLAAQDYAKTRRHRRGPKAEDIINRFIDPSGQNAIGGHHKFAALCHLDSHSDTPQRCRNRCGRSCCEHLRRGAIGPRRLCSSTPSKRSSGSSSGRLCRASGARSTS